MKIGSVFENNRTQAVRLPVRTRFPAQIKKVMVRVCGPDIGSRLKPQAGQDQKSHGAGMRA